MKTKVGNVSIFFDIRWYSEISVSEILKLAVPLLRFC